MLSQKFLSRLIVKIESENQKLFRIKSNVLSNKKTNKKKFLNKN